MIKRSGDRGEVREQLLQMLDPVAIEAEIDMLCGAHYSYREVKACVDFEIANRPQLVVDTIREARDGKQAKVDALDSDNSRLRELLENNEAERARLYGTAPVSQEVSVDPGSILEQMLKDASHTRLPIDQQTFNGRTNDLFDRALSEPPFTLVGLASGHDGVTFRPFGYRHITKKLRTFMVIKRDCFLELQMV